MDISETYGGRIRVRVGALIFDGDDDPGALLLVRHVDRSHGEAFWTPPGGGVEFGESLSEALGREVAEETGLQVAVGELLYTLDFVRPPLHAVSFYFRCRPEAGEITIGSDPELEDLEQFIDDVRFIPFTQFDRHPIVPEDLPDHLVEDLKKSTGPATAQYLGTKR